MSKILKCLIIIGAISSCWAFPVYDTITFSNIDSNMNNNFTTPGDIVYCNLTGGPNHDRKYTKTFVLTSVQNITQGVTVCIEGGPGGQNGFDEFTDLANKECGMYPGDNTSTQNGWAAYVSQMGGNDWGVESGSCANNPIGTKE